MKWGRIAAFTVAIAVVIAAFTVANSFLDACVEACYANDDWAPQTTFRRDIDVQMQIEGLDSLSQLISAAYEIAHGLDADAWLTTTNFRAEDMGHTGSIEFIFASHHEWRNQMTQVTLNFDVDSLTFFRANFVRGHSRWVGGGLMPISYEYINMTLEELLSVVEEMKEVNLAEIDNVIRIELSSDRICAIILGSGVTRICKR